MKWYFRVPTRLPPWSCRGSETGRITSSPSCHLFVTFGFHSAILLDGTAPRVRGNCAFMLGLNLQFVD
jgi:hypothetical protein